jgi:hypothetical protein
VPVGIIPEIPAGTAAVQVKLVPTVALLKLTKAEEEPEHKV